MTDIKYESKGSLLRPFKALAFLGREPVTEPMGPRPASENYRGFHLNDWEKCIGCGTCKKICDNQAIRMVSIPDLPADPVKGIRAERPAMDYGRCCWCGLCVDLCPTGSLSLSREYVHTCTEEQISSYFILPDPKGMHGQGYEKGWAKTADADLIDLERQPMHQLAPDERTDSFAEVVDGFDPQSALLEASRCIQCGMCHDACPSNMDAPQYIRAIWSDDLEAAIEHIYDTNPLAHVCGRVCTHRCESACSIGIRGKPLSIRWLKRYAMDQVGHDRVRDIVSKRKAPLPDSGKIAIIGAGPAGLTAAYDLALQGFQVTIYEGLPQGGGMTRYGIPEYRLPYNRLDDDIDIITSLGVVIHYDTWVGRDISMTQLEQDNDAVIVANGLHLGRSTRIPGSDHAQVYSAIDLLRKITLGEHFDIPQRAVVIGGGNVAMDIARSLLRLQQRTHGRTDVTVTTLEARDQMMAAADEIEEAEEEGVVIINSRGPRQCTVDKEVLTGLETVHCISVFDAEGRFHPQYDEDDLTLYGADMVVEAIGQAPDNDFLGELLTERLEWVRGRLKIDEEGRTSEPWLWAAGDAVEGPDVIHAIAGGHRVANSIQQHLASLRKASA